MSNSDQQREGQPPREEEQIHPGSQLRQVREEKGLSVEEVSAATRVSAANIRAIEAGEYERLPADTFVRGHVTLYANHLGLDGPAMAREFLAGRHQDAGSGSGHRKRKNTPSHLSPKKLAEPTHVSTATIALILLVVIVTSFTGFCLYTSWNPLAFLWNRDQGPATTFPVPAPTADVAGQPADPTNQDQSEADRSTAAPLSYTLTAHFRKTTTVTVTIDGQPAREEKVQAGGDRTWTAHQSLTISFADPDAATLEFNGSRLKFPPPGADNRPTLTLPDDLLDL